MLEKMRSAWSVVNSSLIPPVSGCNRSLIHLLSGEINTPLYASITCTRSTHTSHLEIAVFLTSAYFFVQLRGTPLVKLCNATLHSTQSTKPLKILTQPGLAQKAVLEDSCTFPCLQHRNAAGNLERRLRQALALLFLSPALALSFLSLPLPRTCRTWYSQYRF